MAGSFSTGLGRNSLPTWAALQLPSYPSFLGIVHQPLSCSVIESTQGSEHMIRTHTTTVPHL